MNTHPGRHVYPATVRKIYKTMRLDPDKDFGIKDFDNSCSSSTRNALNLLIALHVVKIVPAVYYCGANRQVRREVKRYRLIGHHSIVPKDI